MISVTTGTIDINFIPQKQRGKAQNKMMALLLNQIKVIYKQNVKGQTLQMGEKNLNKYFHLKHLIV